MGNYPDSPSEAAKTFRQQRTVPRYTFVANTELTDFATSRKTWGSVEEISRKGCYVDTMNVLPEGTSLEVSISRDQETFITKGEVIYVLERRGMGIGFIDTSNDQLQVLESWLAERESIVAII